MFISLRQNLRYNKLEVLSTSHAGRVFSGAAPIASGQGLGGTLLVQLVRVLQVFVVLPLHRLQLRLQRVNRDQRLALPLVQRFNLV